MPAAGKKITNMRLGDISEARLDQIAEEKGWSKTQVIRVALEDLHRRTFGRRSADMVPGQQAQEGRGDVSRPAGGDDRDATIEVRP